MATIGRAFAFYIEYWGQMAYMAEHQEEALAKASRQHNWEETKEQIQAVRDRANKQAAVLLEECGHAMKERLEDLGYKVDQSTQEGTVERDWYVLYKLAKKEGRGRKVWRTAGASIECLPGKKTPSILLGLRAPAVAGAEELEGVLGKCICTGADLTGWSANWVFFTEVPIKLSGSDNWRRLERYGTRLVEKTREAMKEKINKRVVRTLLSL